MLRCLCQSGPEAFCYTKICSSDDGTPYRLMEMLKSLAYEPFRNEGISWVRWHMPLLLALEKQRQADSYEFEVSRVYTVSSRPANAT